MPKASDEQPLISEKIEDSSNHCYEIYQSESVNRGHSENGLTNSHKSTLESQTSEHSLTWNEKKIMLGMTLVSFLKGSLMAVMVPFFPVEAASRGVPQTTISAIFSCFSMAKMVLSPIVGYVAPIIGVTRLYNIGIATAGVTTIAFGTLYHIGDTQLFIASCFLVRLAEAAGTTAVTGCAFTIIASQFPKHTSRMVALNAGAYSMGLSLAPVIGSGLYSIAGFSLPFYVTGGTMVAAAALNYWFMPALDRYERTSVPYLSMLRVFSKSSQNWMCIINVFQIALVLLTFDTSIAPYADKVLGITPSTLGLYFTVATVAYALTSWLWARVTDRARHPHAFIGVGLLVVSASLLLIPPSPLLGLAPRWWLLGLGMTLMESSFGGAYIPSFQLMLTAARRHGLPNDLVTKAFVSSVLSTVFSMGCVVGPPLTGLMVDAYGFPVMMTCLAGLVLVVSLLNITFAVFVSHHHEDYTSCSAADI